MSQYTLGARDSVFLQHLLRMHPVECHSQKEIIFTIAPRLWERRLLGENVVLIDLSSLLGMSSMLRQKKDDGRLINTLVQAGWPAHVVQPAWLAHPYFLNADIGIVGPDNELLMIFTEDSIHHLPSVRITYLDDLFDDIPPTPAPTIKQRLDLLLLQTPAIWACILDHDQQDAYHLLNRNTGEYQILAQPPTSHDLGVIKETFSSTVVFASNIIKPKSIQTLVDFVISWSPQHVILDHTLSTCMDWKEEDRLMEFAQVLQRTVPDKIPEKLNSFPHPYWCAILGLVYWSLGLDSSDSVNALVPWPLPSQPYLEKVREQLVRYKSLFGVLEFSRYSFGISDFDATLLCFGGGRKKTLFKILHGVDHNLTPTHPWFSQNNPEIDECDDEYITSLVPGIPWTVAAHNPNNLAELYRIEGLGESVTLSQLCEIKQGIPKESLVDGPDDVAFINSYTVKYSSSPDHSSIKIDGDISDFFLVPQDLLVPITCDKYSPQKLFVYSGDQKSIFSNDLIRLRIIDQRINQPYLIAYLNYVLELGLLQIFASDHGGHEAAYGELDSLSLKNFRVPLPDSKLVNEWPESETIRLGLNKKADELIEKLNGLFIAKDRREFRDNLTGLRRYGRLLRASLEKIEQENFQIANFYPYPIAYAYRLLASIVHPTDRYREQLRVAENLLAFLASISLCILTTEKRNQTGLDFKKLWGSGISPGHWSNIFSRCLNTLGKDDHPLRWSMQNLRPDVYQKGFGADLNELIKAKNDFKHDRGPKTDEDIRNSSDEIMHRLDCCMFALAFFTDFPIHQVQQIDVDRNGNTILTCLRYVGDHPGLPQEVVHFPKPLSRGDLFLELGAQEWVSLYPFIVTHNCPTCKVKETYFIDKWDSQKGIVYYKSFERGHTIERSDASRDLENWGSSLG